MNKTTEDEKKQYNKRPLPRSVPLALSFISHFPFIRLNIFSFIHYSLWLAPYVLCLLSLYMTAHPTAVASRWCRAAACTAS